MDNRPPAFQVGDFKTLPLYYLCGVTQETIAQFASGKVEIQYVPPEYPPFTYDLSSEWLGKVAKDSAVASQMVQDWLRHAASFQYFVQIKDDKDRMRISSLNSHTELVSALCDARLGIDTAPLWAKFDNLHPFELIHSEYRADNDRDVKYAEYAQRLAAAYERLSSKEFETIRLIQRIVRQIELKKGQWATMPLLSSPLSPITDAAAPKPIKLFYSYSHKDEGLRDQLETHLASLQRQEVITEWHDRNITGGTEWKGQIDENLERSEIILLLVSADFIASDYCYDIETKRALERHDEGSARVIPVILRACDWHGMPFQKLQAFPKDAKAITSWTNIDEAFTDVSKGIRKVAEELRKTK